MTVLSYQQIRHPAATNGADGSSYAGDAATGIGRRDHGRRGHDLVITCSVTAAHTSGAAGRAG